MSEACRQIQSANGLPDDLKSLRDLGRFDRGSIPQVQTITYLQWQTS